MFHGGTLLPKQKTEDRGQKTEERGKRKEERNGDFSLREKG